VSQRLEQIGHIGALLSGAGAIMAVVVGGSALIYAGDQIQESRRNDARDSYRDFMVLAMDNPDFSAPDYTAIAKDPKQSERYAWFVADMLTAFEQVMESHPVDSAWRTSIRRGLQDHKDYLLSKDFQDEICDYDPGFRDEMHVAVGLKLHPCPRLVN
jgi:hypothetical protein